MITRKEPSAYIEVDLTGPKGNAFYLIGLASSIARKIGKDEYTIREEMMSGDYKNLIKVLEREFGDYIILKTDNPEDFE